MKFSPSLKFSTRVAFTFLLVAFLLHATARFIYPLWIPPVHFVVEQLLPEYRIDFLDIGSGNGETVYAISATLKQIFVVGTTVYPAGISVTATTSANHSLLGYLVMSMIVLHWPELGLRARIAGLSFGLLYTSIATLADIPFELAGAIDGLFLVNSGLENHPSGVQIWVSWLDGGGRLLLGMGAALGALLSIRLRFFHGVKHAVRT